MAKPKARRAIIREWMALAREKRQSGQQALAFAKAAITNACVLRRVVAAGDKRGTGLMRMSFSRRVPAAELRGHPVYEHSQGPSRSTPSCLPISLARADRRRPLPASRWAASRRSIRSRPPTTRPTERPRSLSRRSRSVASANARRNGRWKRERRQHAVDKAQSALDAARRKHEKNAADIQTQIEVLEEMSQAEDAHWEKERERLEAALRRARG